MRTATIEYRFQEVPHTDGGKAMRSEAHACYHYALEYHAHLAEKLILAVVGQTIMKDALLQINNESLKAHGPIPKQIASFACDVAQAMLHEFEDRNWIEFGKPPDYTRQPHQIPKGEGT